MLLGPEYEMAACGLVLDRMEIEDVGGNPARLAAAIHQQIGPGAGAVPVHAIAKALDIVEIEAKPLLGIEAALLTTPERDIGSIVTNVAANRQRQRFSIGHELGHFLNPRHQGAWNGAFRCDRHDLGGGRRVGVSNKVTRFVMQERQANTFAIELLAPPARMRPFLDADPTLNMAMDMARGLDISREAAVRRYVDRHHANLAVVFAQNGRLAYAIRGKSFPLLALTRDVQMPSLPEVQGSEPLSCLEEADPDDWIRNSGGALIVQTLHQQNQRSTTLLILLDRDVDEDSKGQWCSPSGG